MAKESNKDNSSSTAHQSTPHYINSSSQVNQQQQSGSPTQDPTQASTNRHNSTIPQLDMMIANNNQALSSSEVKQASNNRQIGHYIVGRSLGQGTFGKVRLGTHILTGEKVAIKILEKDKIKDQSDVERVTREIHILKIVRHPNVIQLYEIIETSKQLFLIMEYANGGELFDYIVKRKRLQEAEACKFFQQIISGVEYIHRVRICHRDLKPENLLLDDKNNIKIVDFGLSNTYRDGETLKTACGSPCYAAPEMIAGKRYHGLISDIWSCGIILYAMSCGYLPFEDPNTNKLYKKILSCDYLIPGFISSNCKDLIKKILNTDPVTRHAIKDIRAHEWFSQVKGVDSSGIVVGKDTIPIIEEAVQSMIRDVTTPTINTNGNSSSGIQMESMQDPNFYSQACNYIQNNKHNQVTSTYYLILKKLERESGRNYVYEQVQRDKKKYETSAGNLSTVNFGSPSQTNKVSAPTKLLMNQTAMVGSGAFNRAGPQGSSKSSDGQHHAHQFSMSSNPQTKKYLDQIERIYTKRTESTGGGQQRPTTDYSTVQINTLVPGGGAALNESINSGSGGYYQSNQPRGGQSQSPNSRVLNIANTQSNNGSAGPSINAQGGQQQTFYMADRLKKNHQGVLLKQQNHHNRQGSADDKNESAIIIQSTNDSRVEEMLPNVGNQGGPQLQHRKQNKSVQMRSTMYNNSYFQKLINNVQGATGQKILLQNEQNMNALNILDMKRQTQKQTNSQDNGNSSPSHVIPPQTAGNLAQNIMIKTSYGGFNQQQQTPSYVTNGAALHNNAISKALAQQKIRKLRHIQNSGGGSQPRTSIANQHLINYSNGEHSFSQDLSHHHGGSSSDQLNQTTLNATSENHFNSQINVPNIETLIPVSSNALGGKNLTQKKIDSNLFTQYRASQGGQKKQQAKNGNNRFGDSILNNSITAIGGSGGQDYAPLSTTVQSNLLGSGEHQHPHSYNQMPTTGGIPLSGGQTASRFFSSNNTKHNRFLSSQPTSSGQQQANTSSQKNHQTIPVFQNNFILPPHQQSVGKPQFGQKTAANGFYTSVSAKNHPPQSVIVNNNIMINQSIVITNQNVSGGQNQSGASPKMQQLIPNGNGWISQELPTSYLNQHINGGTFIPHTAGAPGSQGIQNKGEFRVKMMNGTQSSFNAHQGAVGGAYNNKRIMIL